MILTQQAKEFFCLPYLPIAAIFVVAGWQFSTLILLLSL